MPPMPSSGFAAASSPRVALAQSWYAERARVGASGSFLAWWERWARGVGESGLDPRRAGSAARPA